MANVFEVMAKLSGNSTGMVSAFKQAASAAESYRDRVRQATAGAVDGQAAAKSAHAAGQETGNQFASGFKGVMAGAGLIAATIGLGAMVKEAAAASDSVDKFKATMNFAGLDTSAIDQATKAAKDFADQTVYDLPTISNTIAQLASNGIKDYTGLTKAAGNLNAVAGGNAETFKSVAMMMTQTAGAGKLTTENWNQLSDAIPGAAGPLMRALEEAGAYTGNFREAMEKGQISADEFNAALMKLGNDPVAVEAAKSTKTFEGALGGLQATINSGLVGALNAIKPAATGAINAVSAGLGGAFTWMGQAATGLKALFVSNDFSGALREAFNVEEDSPMVVLLFKAKRGADELAGAVRAFGAAWRDNNGDVTSDGLAGVFERVANLAREVTGGVRAFFAAFISGGNDVTSSGFPGFLEELGLKARALADQLGPVISGAFSQISAALAPAVPALITLFTAISPVGLALAALTPVIPILAAAAGTLAAALGGALATTLAAIAPVIAGIVTWVADAVTWFMSLDGAAEALAAGVAVMVIGLNVYKGAVIAISAVTKAWAAVQAVLAAVMAVNPVTLIIIGIAALIAAIVLLVANWDTVVNTITVIWGGFVNWITGVMEGFAGWLGGLWAGIVAGVSAFAAVLFAPIVDAWNAVLGFFTGVGDAIAGVWTWVTNLLTAIGQAFWAEHGAQLTGAWNFIVGIFTGIANFIASVWNGIVSVVTAYVTAYINVVVAVFTAVWSFISSIFTTVASFISSVWNGIVGVISGVVNTIWNVVRGAFTGVWNTVSSIFNQVAGFIGGIWGGIVNSISGAVGNIVNVVTGIRDKVVGAVSGAVGWLADAGRNVVQGFINGVSSLAGTIGNAFLSMVPGWIVGPFKAALGIASPSKLFKQFGRWVIQGLGIGVQQEERTAVGAMARAADAVTAAGSGITIEVPKITVPQMPDLTGSLALPELTQVVRLSYVGESPLEAMGRMAREVSAAGPDAYVAGMGGGYDAAALGARTATAVQEAPVVQVNVTARVTNPFTGEEVEAYVADVATEVTAGAVSGTARVVRNSRTGGQEGF